MYNVYVEDQRVDLVSNNLVLNEQLYNITNPSQRNVLFSNLIVLGRTANNTKIFNLLSDDILDKTFGAKIYLQTVLVSEATVLVKSISSSTFKIQIINALSLFYNNIDKPLFELDLDSDDYYFGASSYTTLKGLLTGSLFYPLCDFRGYDNTSELLIGSGLEVNRKYLRHSYLVKNILNNIITEAGYEPDLSILDNDLIVTSNHDHFYFTDYQFSFLGQSVTLGDYADNTGGTLEITSQNNFLVKSNAFEFQITRIPSRFAIEITLEQDAYLFVKKRNVAAGINEIFETHFIEGTTKIITDAYDLGLFVGFQFDRDVVITSMRMISLLNEADYYSATDVVIWSNGDLALDGWNRTNSVSATIPLLELYYIKSAYNLPDMTQKKFVLDFFKLYNMYFEILNGIVTLKQNTLGEAINVELANEPVDNGKISLSQNNFLKYTNDIESDNIYNNYAQFNKTYDNNSKTESNLVEMPFSASIDVRNEDQAGYEFDLTKIPIYNGESNIPEDRLQQSLRFLLITTNSTGVDASYNGVFQVGLTNNLNFVNLYERFYSEYYDYLNNPKLKTMKLKLTLAKWLLIRASGKIYYKGNEYIVLQINKFNPNRLTEIKAVTIGVAKIGDTSPVSENWENVNTNWENVATNWEST